MKATLSIPFLSALLCGLVFVSAGGAERPHIVVILVDDMGYGDPGCYNPESKIPTPRIDALAREGMRFTDAHAPGPLCHMSRYGLMTGRYPFRTDVSRWPSHALIENGQTTVPSLLKTQGMLRPQAGEPVVQLFNMKSDRGETTNVAADHPAIVARLRTTFGKIRIP